MVFYFYMSPAKTDLQWLELLESLLQESIAESISQADCALILKINPRTNKAEILQSCNHKSTIALIGCGITRQRITNARPNSRAVENNTRRLRGLLRHYIPKLMRDCDQNSMIELTFALKQGRVRQFKRAIVSTYNTEDD